VIKPALIPIEGPEKAIRGGEWKPIKISRWNSAYIPKSTQRPSLLTQPRPHRYSKAIGLQNRVTNRSGNTKQCRQEHVRDRRQKSDQRVIYILTGISPNNWWARLDNYRLRAIQTRNPRVFSSGDSRTGSASPCNDSHTNRCQNPTLVSTG
jgi:hypothetical protein